MPGDHLGPPAALPLSFEVDGELHELPDLDTRTWITSLVLEPPGCWLVFVPRLRDEDGTDRLWRRLRDPADPWDLDDAEQVVTSVLAAALAMDFWAAHRLAARLWANWLPFDGWSYTRGLDPLREPIGHVLAGGLAWLAGQCEKKVELTKLEHDLWAGPPSVTALGQPREVTPTWADSEEETWKQFEALFGGRGGRG